VLGRSRGGPSSVVRVLPRIENVVVERGFFVANSGCGVVSEVTVT